MELSTDKDPVILDRLPDRAARSAQIEMGLTGLSPRRGHGYIDLAGNQFFFLSGQIIKPRMSTKQLAPYDGPDMTEPPNGLKILYVVSEDFYFYTHRLRLACYAKARGARVYLITNLDSRKHAIQDRGIVAFHNPLDRGSMKLWRDVRYLIKLTKILHMERPLVVHNVALKPCLYGSIAASLLPSIHTVNAIAGLGGSLSGTSIAARSFRYVLTKVLGVLLDGDRKSVIVQNERDLTFTIDKCGVTSRKVHLIRGAGVDTNTFSPHPEPQSPRIRIAMVCRMLRPKGVYELAEAGKNLKSLGLDFEIELVGDPDPGNRQSLTQEELVALNSLGFVSWTGPEENVPSVWRRSHIAVLPTWYGEGIPKCLIEAASCGRPIVTSNISGCDDIVQQGVNGLLVEPRNVDQLTSALASLISDKSLRERLGRAGRERVLSHFSEERIFGQTLSTYLSGFSRIRAI